MPNGSRSDAIDEARLATWIAVTLRLGVVVAALFMVVGVIMAVGFGRGEPPSPDVAMGKVFIERAITPGGIWRGLAAFDGPSFIHAGLLVLILTPTARVAITVIYFFSTRAMLFGLLALFVFGLLALGLLGIVGG